jgi:hypothetical protein
MVGGANKSEKKKIKQRINVFDTLDMFFPPKREPLYGSSLRIHVDGYGKNDRQQKYGPKNLYYRKTRDGSKDKK